MSSLCPRRCARATPMPRISGAAGVPKPKPADRMVTSGSGSIESTISGTTIACSGSGRPNRAFVMAGRRPIDSALTIVVSIRAAVAVVADHAVDLVHHHADQPGAAPLEL